MTRPSHRFSAPAAASFLAALLAFGPVQAQAADAVGTNTITMIVPFSATGLQGFTSVSVLCYVLLPGSGTQVGSARSASIPVGPDGSVAPTELRLPIEQIAGKPEIAGADRYSCGALGSYNGGGGRGFSVGARDGTDPLKLKHGPVAVGGTLR